MYTEEEGIETQGMLVYFFLWLIPDNLQPNLMQGQRRINQIYDQIGTKAVSGWLILCGEDGD